MLFRDEPAITTARSVGVGLTPMRPQREPSASPARAQREPSASPVRAQREPSASPARAQREPSASPARAQREPRASPARAQRAPSASPARAPDAPRSAPYAPQCAINEPTHPLSMRSSARRPSLPPIPWAGRRSGSRPRSLLSTPRCPVAARAMKSEPTRQLAAVRARRRTPPHRPRSRRTRGASGCLHSSS